MNEQPRISESPTPTATNNVFDFASLVSVPDGWPHNYLIHQFEHKSNKSKTHLYSIRFSGNKIQHNAITDFLWDCLPYYVHPKSKIENIGMSRSIREALHYFGTKDPLKDGKYGELLLYVFVESVLKCPQIAYREPLKT